MAFVNLLLPGLSALGLIGTIYAGGRFLSLDSDYKTLGYIFQRSVKPMYFKDRVIWITGASSGIGEALCHFLVSLNVGVKLILSARKEETLRNVKNDLIIKNKNQTYNMDHNIYILPIDLTNKNVSYYQKKYNLIKTHFNISSIDMLVNNAGIGMKSTFQRFNMSNCTDLLQINFVSPIILTKLVLNDAINNNEKNPFLHICNIGSLAVYFSLATQTVYSASKNGLLSFGISLSDEMIKYPNITITDFLPGAVATSIDQHLLVHDGQKQNTQSRLIQKGMKPERCAELIAIALSNKLRESWTFCRSQEVVVVYFTYFFPWLSKKTIRKWLSQHWAKKVKSKL